ASRPMSGRSASERWRSWNVPEPRREASLLRLLLVVLGQGLHGDAEGIDRGRNAAIDAHLQQHLADLLAAAAVPERALDVHLELVRAVVRADHGEVDDRAGLLRQFIAAPDGAPAIFRHQFLERAVELRRVGDRPLGELLAENRLPDFEAALVGLLVHGL